jgi:leucyl aminopeptidase
MNITLSNATPASFAADVLAVGVTSQGLARDPILARLNQATGGALIPYLKQEGFKAKEGQVLHMLGRGRLKAKRLTIVGLGEQAQSARSARVLAVQAARATASKASSLALVAGSLDDATLRALAEGTVTGAYRYTRYLTGDRKPRHELKKATILVDGKLTPAARNAVDAGQSIGESINFARDLVNSPPNDLSATQLAELAALEAKRFGIACKTFDKKGIAKLGMPLLLAVNRGSTEEPRFFHLSYKPAVAKAPKVAFVGKGLTFDSGGLCLKTADGMLDMKADMAGAAATVAIVLCAARLRLPIEVHGVVASTDNMSGGDAYRPGDVFPSRDGKTVEIINTDAEGRLILADALAYARELEPDYLIDHATLTGACLVALGNYRAGLFSNDDGLLQAYQKAAQTSGENVWPMPLDEDMRDQLKSSIADLKHTGSRYGGSITAALFLREFIGSCRWAHLDIAGPAFQSDNRMTQPKGGTGFGVLTAVEFLRGLTHSEAAPT